jgi:hypothetical protein
MSSYSESDANFLLTVTGTILRWKDGEVAAVAFEGGNETLGSKTTKSTFALLQDFVHTFQFDPLL